MTKTRRKRLDRETAVTLGVGVGFFLSLALQTIVPRPFWFELGQFLLTEFLCIKTAGALVTLNALKKKPTRSQREK